MAEGLKIVKEILERAKQVQSESYVAQAYMGVNLAVLVLSDPINADLWKRLKEYCEEE